MTGSVAVREDGEAWTPAGQCAIFACDIAAFGDRRRPDRIREVMRNALYRGLRTAFDRAGVPLDGCYREDRGDGAMILMRPEHSTALLLTTVLDVLRGELRDHNDAANDIAKIRLRVAVNTGEAHKDPEGLVGSAVNHAFRILDAPIFKQVLDISGECLALIVSERVHEDVVHHGRGMVDPADYRQVGLTVKETAGTAWVRVPGIRIDDALLDAAARALTKSTAGTADRAAGAAEEETGPADGPAGTAMAPAPAPGGPPDGPRRGRQPTAPARDLRNPREYGPGVRPSRNTGTMELFGLVDLMQQIPTMAAEHSRDQVVRLLPPEIAGAIARHPETRADILSIARTCLDYTDGLQLLVELIRGFAGDSIHVLRLEESIDRLMGP